MCIDIRGGGSPVDALAEREREREGKRERKRERERGREREGQKGGSAREGERAMRAPTMGGGGPLRGDATTFEIRLPKII